MSTFIDIKYLNLVSPRLQNYKIKTNSPFTANFRCAICGDSRKNKFKSRGYVFTKKGGLFYKCHNCGYSASFGNFLKQIDITLYDQYALELYKEGSNPRKVSANVVSMFEFAQPVFKKKTLLDQLLDKVNDTPAENYLISRKIPNDRWDELYYIDDISKIEQLSEKYKDRIIGTEARLVIPFYQKSGQLVGVTCRALDDNKQRYVTVRVNEEYPMIYNIHNIDTSKPIYVTEGPLDSMFLDNAVAVGNSDLKVVKQHLPKDNVVLIFDNQPRNKELIKIISRAVEDNFTIVIWPENIVEKDVNEMVLAGLDVPSIISSHTYKGLELKLMFAKWRKLNDAL